MFLWRKTFHGYLLLGTFSGNFHLFWNPLLDLRTRLHKMFVWFVYLNLLFFSLLHGVLNSQRLGSAACLWYLLIHWFQVFWVNAISCLSGDMSRNKGQRVLKLPFLTYHNMYSNVVDTIIFIFMFSGNTHTCSNTSNLISCNWLSWLIRRLRLCLLFVIFLNYFSLDSRANILMQAKLLLQVLDQNSGIHHTEQVQALLTNTSW